MKSKNFDWTYCVKGIKGSLPPPGVRVIIAVQTRYKDKNDQMIYWKPYAKRSEPEYMEILGMVKEGRIHISKVTAWKKIS